MTSKGWMVLSGVVVAAVLAAVAAGVRESEWEGLTETEARAKLNAKLPNRIPEEKRSRIVDKAVNRMGNEGILVADDDATDGSSPASET